MKRSHVNSAVLERLAELRGNEKVNIAFNRVTQLNEALKNLEQVSTTPDPRESDSRHLERLSADSARFKATVKTAEDAIKNELLFQANRIKGEIIEAAKLTPTENAAEIRSVFRSLPMKDRMDELGRAVQEKDAEVLSALFGSSQLLTGIDRKRVDDLMAQYQQQAAPHLTMELESVSQFMESVQQVFDGLHAGAASVVDQGALKKAADPARVQNDQRQAQAALEARQAFQSAMA